MKLLLDEIRRNPLLWLLVFVPAVLIVEKLRPEASWFFKSAVSAARRGDDRLFQQSHSRCLSNLL